MKKCELCFEIKPLPYFFNCSRRKDGKQGYCKDCSNKKTRERIAADPGISKKQYLSRKGSPRYMEQMRRASSKYRLKNREAAGARVEAWRLRNLHKRAADTAKHLAAKRRAIPKWVDFDAIDNVYREAAYMQMEVDHIVPLQSKLVCGLHVVDNLQLLPKIENIRKSNRAWPDMPTQAASANVFNIAGWAET